MGAKTRRILTAAVAACLLPSLCAGAPPPVNLKITSPAYTAPKKAGVMYESGTPLEFEATVNSSLGIYSFGAYVGKGAPGWIVFADPDGCLEIGVSFGLPTAYQPDCLVNMFGLPKDMDTFLNPALVVPDETYLEFRVDSDAPGSPDFGSDPALGDPSKSGEPVLLGLTTQLIGDSGGGPGPQVELDVGPLTGGSVDDGYGYGADDDFRGLVLLSNAGVGIVYEDADGMPGTPLANFTPASPRTLRNLAGFLDWVSYELKSNDGKTVIHAGMTLPDGLIAPILAVDNCISNDPGDTSCSFPGQYQLDGGPLLPNGDSPAPELWRQLLPTLTFEVRAFVVSGAAPSRLSDLDNDGEVTAADAKLGGYKVISNESISRFSEFPATLCSEQNALVNVFLADFDGNGISNAHIDCPPGPGSLKKIP